jgi:hypothetical protein
MVKKLHEWKTISERPAVRRKIGWQNDIKEDLRIMKINNWTKCIEDRVKREEEEENEEEEGEWEEENEE